MKYPLTAHMVATAVFVVLAIFYDEAEGAWGIVAAILLGGGFGGFAYYWYKDGHEQGYNDSQMDLRDGEAKRSPYTT